MAFFKTENSLTVASAYDGNKMNALIKADDTIVFDALLGLLQSTCNSLNVSKTLDNFQAMEIVYMIMNDYKHMTIESITLAFKYGKQGKYGPTFNRVDIEIISGWLHAYSTSDEYIDNIERANRKATPVESNEPLTPTAKEWLSKIKNNLANTGERPNHKQQAIRAEIRRQKLIDTVFTKSDSELKQMKKEFESEDYKIGINIVEKEIQKRKNKKV